MKIYHELYIIVFSMMGTLLLYEVLRQFLRYIPADTIIYAILGVIFLSVAIAMKRKWNGNEKEKPPT